MKVLIVDDIEESRLMLHDLLQSRGFEPLQAGDGLSALEIARREHPQLIISDILMPRMDGFELCKQINTDPELAGTRFVFCTASFIEPKDERLAIELGASLFVRKPVEPESFMESIEAVLKEPGAVGTTVADGPNGHAGELEALHQARLTDKLYEKVLELETAHNSFSNLISNLPGMVYRCHNNLDRDMEYVSDLCHRLTGYTADALIHSRDVAYGTLIVDSDREYVRGEIQAASDDDRAFEIEYRLQCRDGSVIRVWEQGRCINPGAEHEYLEGYIADVTDWRQAELDRNRFFSLSLDMLSVAGMDGYFKLVSPAWTRVLGWSETEMRMRPWKELVHPDDLEASLQTADEMYEGKQIYAFENRYRHKDGGYRWLSWNAMPLPEEGLLYGVARDITESIRYRQQLEHHNRALQILSAGNRVLVDSGDETSLLESICRVVQERGGYSLAMIGYLSENGGRIQPKCDIGADDDFLEKFQSLAAAVETDSPEASAIRLRETQVVQDIRDATDGDWKDICRDTGYHAMIALPIHQKGQVFGMLAIYDRRAGSFIPEEVEMLQELADNTAQGIALLRMQEAKLHAEHEHEQSLLQAIRAISLTVEKRDPYTSGHQDRVARLASAIASEMGLPTDRVDGIRLGAMIHDIGKIYVPADILNRPGRLTEQEYGIVRMHPEVGYDIVKDVSFPWPIAQMIRQHHERMDGSGYPQGLKQDEILLEARIMAVADVVEAISSHRPYRAALGLEAGMREINDNRGSLYDPVVVDACARLMDDGRFAFTERT